MMLRFLDGKVLRQRARMRAEGNKQQRQCRAAISQPHHFNSSHKAAPFSARLSRRLFANHSECRLQLRWAAPYEQDALRWRQCRIICLCDRPGRASIESFQGGDTARQGAGRAHIHSRLRRADRGEGRRRPAHRLAGDPVGGRPFADRFRRDADDLFRGPRVRQAGRRGAPLRPRQGRERDSAGRDRAAVHPVRRRDLGGRKAAARRAGSRGGGDACGLRGDHRVRHRGFLPRPRALSGRQRNRERGARSRRAALRLRHVVVDRRAGRARRSGAGLSMGGFGGSPGGRAVRVPRRLAARPAHHRDADRHRAGGLGADGDPRGREGARRDRGRPRAGAAVRRQAVRRGGGGGEPHPAARPRRGAEARCRGSHPRRPSPQRGGRLDRAARARFRVRSRSASW